MVRVRELQKKGQKEKESRQAAERDDVLAATGSKLRMRRLERETGWEMMNFGYPNLSHRTEDAVAILPVSNADV